MGSSGSRPSIPALTQSWLDARPWGAALLLLALTWILWGRTLGFALHYWDDSVYLFQDPRLEGVTGTHFWQVLTKPFFANYHPVTTLTYLFDRALWDRWIVGFHLTHLVFYSAGVVLVYELFRRVLDDKFWALAGAAFFSVHALHSEPISWLACRKDVVCLVFYAAALLAYERYAALRDEGTFPWKSYGLVALFTFLALGAKGYAVILPLAFLSRDLCFSPRTTLKAWLDKLPLLGLAVALALVTVGAQDDSSALIKDMSVLGGLTVMGRIEVLLKIFTLYVGKSFLPVGLNAKYLVGGDNWYPDWMAALGLLLFAGILVFFFRYRRKQPVLAYALALFGLPLATTMNTVFTLRIWMTDRYLFLPTLGSCLFLACLGKNQQLKYPDRRRTNRAAGWAAAGLLLYCALSVARTGVWSSLVLLRSDILRKTAAFLPGDGPVTSVEFVEKARLQAIPVALLENVEDLVIAYERESNPVEAQAFRGLLKQTGRGGSDTAASALQSDRPADAIPLFLAVVEKGEWQAPEAAKGLGDAYTKLNQPEKAREWYRKAYELHKKRGLSGQMPLVGEMALEFNLKNYPRALEILGNLQREAPSDPRGYFFAGRALEEMGHSDMAYPLYEKTESLPASAFTDTGIGPSDVQRQLGATAQKLGKNEEAKKHYTESLRLNPNDPQRAAIEKILSTL